MGPLNPNAELFLENLQKFIQLQGDVEVPADILKDPTAYTSSGKPISSVRTSKAKVPGMGSRATVGGLSREVVRNTNEQAIVRALLELQRPVPVTPSIPTPSTPSTVKPNLLRMAKQITPGALLLELLLYSGELNSNEPAELATRKDTDPTLDTQPNARIRR